MTKIIEAKSIKKSIASFSARVESHRESMMTRKSMRQQQQPQQRKSKPSKPSISIKVVNNSVTQTKSGSRPATPKTPNKPCTPKSPTSKLQQKEKTPVKQPLQIEQIEEVKHTPVVEEKNKVPSKPLNELISNGDVATILVYIIYFRMN